MAGTFSIANHGFPEEHVNSLLALAKAYFALPNESKEELSRSQKLVARGYGFHTFPNGLRHETFLWNEDFERRQASGDPVPGVDPWPRAPNGFRDVVRAAIQPLKELSGRIYQAIALSAGLERDALAFLNEFGSLQLHQYDLGTGLSEHTDLAPLTVVFADEEGLEVKGEGDCWAPAGSTKGSFSCMLPDAAMYLTNDRFTTSLHRVARNGVQRRSVLWTPFCGPNAMIGPLPGVCSEREPPRYAMRPVADVVRGWVAEHT